MSVSRENIQLRLQLKSEPLISYSAGLRLTRSNQLTYAVLKPNRVAMTMLRTIEVQEVIWPLKTRT